MRLQKKNLTRVGIVLGAALLIAAWGSVAYFVASETAHNVISTSGVGIGLYEFADPDGTGDLVPFEDLTNVMPGTTFSKIPYIENNETEPVWVRASISMKVRFEDGTEKKINNPGLFVELGEIGDGWTNGGDGYYYYEQALGAGEATTPYFKKVTFLAAVPSEYKNAKFSLTVKAEGTQVANNGSSAKTAGWGGGE